MLYDIIYDYLFSIFNSTNINGYTLTIMGVETTLSMWLSNTITIVIMVLLFAFMCLVVKWCFKLFVNAFHRI